MVLYVSKLDPKYTVQTEKHPCHVYKRHFEPDGGPERWLFTTERGRPALNVEFEQ